MTEQLEKGGLGRATRIWLLIALAVTACWLMYMAVVPGRSVAHAEPARMWGDAAQQRQDLLEAQQETNQKLDEIIRLLKSGDIRVQAVSQDGEDAPGGRHENATQSDDSAKGETEDASSDL